MTNIPGCFNVGESEFQYHGANRLGANSLLSCIFGGLVAGVEVPRYLDNSQSKLWQSALNIYSRIYGKRRSFKHDLLIESGKENVHKLHDELADLMVQNVTVKRNNKDLQMTLEEIKEIRERYNNISLDDKGQC